MTDLRIAEKRFRPEIEGVRVFAALLVAIYHIWIGSVSGGVDVFFIVSGYLITISLVTKMERQGKINYLEYVLGLTRRLIPLAFTVLFSVALISFIIIPQLQWKQIISEIFSSAFYYQNWQLATNAVDYLAQNNEASPLQHFWALSIQGQFYVTWPLVIFIAYVISTKLLKTPIRKTLLAILSIMFIASIGYSIYITTTNQPWAYFDTFARVWEFCLGGILALLIPYLSLKRAISLIVGWLGLAIICFTGVILPVSTVFPGYAALLPTTGVILVIISAENGSKFGVDRLLGMKPFQYFGNISYGFYLWHWPLLTFYYANFATDTVSFTAGIGIMILTTILSIISAKLIEKPIRKISVRQSKVKLALILFVFIISVMLVNTSWGYYSNKKESKFTDEYHVEDYPGAVAAFGNIKPNPDKEPILQEAEEASLLPSFYSSRSCYSNNKDETEVKICSFGETENPKYTIALVGGSHSGHWFPALEELSEKLKLQIDVYNKDGCRFTDDDMGGRMTEACMEWNENVLEPLMKNSPDIIFTTANVNSEDTVPIGYINQWKKFEEISEIFAIRDNPRMNEKIPLCLETKSIEECSKPREEALSETPPWENTDGIPSNVTFADLSDSFCDAETCYPVIGNIIVYRDQHHLTTLYVKTMAATLEEHLIGALKKVEKSR
ncbi:acyltransferase family protein [Ornithinibacillus sp. L9]|uniref:Acyltransferase family protein n=1 Tax=Ornithinibacillus caprae TaxID=2678566 RepID=A0A6N8FDT6_9BACI|nr:acyltransferase family protein [Ornithinibacillus caprae]MUK87361.1 acyltransferase family protein [Ornithinibacillus caprae]